MSRPYRKHFPDKEATFTDLMGFEVAGFLARFKDAVEQIDQVTGNGGYLSMNGEAPTEEWELQRLGPDIQRNKALLEQMLEQKAIQRDKAGRLFHPDQVKEIHLYQVRSNAGSSSGGRFARANVPANVRLDVDVLDNSNLGESEGDGNLERIRREFNDWSAGYPVRLGTDPDGDAFGEYRKRRENFTPRQLCVARSRYAEEITAAGKDGTEYVLQRKNFLKADNIRKYSANNWKPPASKETPAERVQREARGG